MRSRTRPHAAWGIVLAVALMLPLTGCGGFGDDWLFVVTDSVSDPTWERDVRAILDARCVRCHGTPSRFGAPSSFRLDRYDASEAAGDRDGAFEKRFRILERAVRFRTMPPDDPLGDGERSLLEEWVIDGAPRE